ncbi:hypothetical protein BDQ17DRAFT_1243696, partial [Cyathus striatus]
YGIDLGLNRPNLMFLVWPMEHLVESMADLLAFIPKDLTEHSAFVKTLVYLKTCRQAHRACRLCCHLVERQYHNVMYAVTAMSSESFKDNVMQCFLDGRCRILFATMAVGMGTDIPDIEQVVVFGVDSLSSAYQKGGCSGHSPSIHATMI